MRLLLRLDIIKSDYVCVHANDRMLIFNLLQNVRNNGGVRSLSPCEQTTRWDHVGDLVRITGQQEESSSLTDGWQERRSGRRSRWEKRDTKPSTLTGRVRRISQGAKPRSPAKARPRQMRGAARGSPGGYGDSRWGSGEDHLLALTTRGCWSWEWWVMVI